MSRKTTLDINAWTSSGETVLFPAVRRADVDVLAALLWVGADPNCRAKDGRRALDMAQGPARVA